jgi:hypothetical protein
VADELATPMEIFVWPRSDEERSTQESVLDRRDQILSVGLLLIEQGVT